MMSENVIGVGGGEHALSWKSAQSSKAAHQTCGFNSSIGIDRVAMCVSDILAHGAEPLFFLDYFTCNSLDVEVASHIISGISEGRCGAGCAVIGDDSGDCNLASLSVEAAERSDTMSLTSGIAVGDVVLALMSNGIHHNGYGLVRKIVKNAGLQFSDPSPVSSSGESLAEALLVPTRIYVKSVVPALKSGCVKALAHISEGGLTENIPRVLPPRTRVNIDATSWNIPPIFGWLCTAGGISEKEMLGTFNCGVGLILIVSPNDVEKVLSLIVDEKAAVIGSVEASPADDSHRVTVKNFAVAVDKVLRPFLPPVIQKQAKPNKRVAVLISGSDSNLQALIDSTQNHACKMGCEIVLVLSNRRNAEGLQRAQQAGIATKVVCDTDFKYRHLFDMVCQSILRRARVDIVCLVGFAYNFSGSFVRQWRGRMLDIHPLLVPLGTCVQRQALDAGARIFGCTVNFVEEDVEASPILVEKSVSVEYGDTEETLTRRIKNVENEAFPEALKLVANDKVYFETDSNRLVWLD